MLSDASRARPTVPAVDDRLAPPETRYEVLGGELVYVPPADSLHATRHSKISALVEAHAGRELGVASDMLTRLSKVDDRAPDVSVFPLARNPETGARQIEQLAFEVVSTESLRHAGVKAAQLVGRGVRRVFAIDVERSRALEWSAALGTWSVLDPAGRIEDPALAVPLPIADLVNTAKADDSVARALIAKRNPVIEEVREQDRARGKAEALLTVLAARRVAVDGTARARILGEHDRVQLERWLTRAVTCDTLAELFGDTQAELFGEP